MPVDTLRPSRKYKPACSGLRMLKKKAQTGQPKTQLILAAPVIINDTCQLPGFVVNLSPIVTTLKHLKNVTMLTNPWAPTSVQHQEEVFFNEALACVRPQTWWVPTVRLSTYSPLQIPLVCSACSQRQTAASRRAHKAAGEDPIT